MEAVVLVGLPASGKSSFFKERLFSTHVRISLDLLKTRHREQRLLATCLESNQRFAVDNTNPTRLERAAYIAAAKASHFAIVGYYFQSKIEDCLRRNARRRPGERVPDVAVLATAKKLEIPRLDEGFDGLRYVRLVENSFVVEEWQDEF